MTLPPPSAGKSTTREPITEQQFLEDIEQRAGADVRDLALWVLDEAKQRGWWIDWNATAGPIVKYQDPETGIHITLFQLYRSGVLTEMRRYCQRFSKMELPDTVWQTYMDEVAALVPGAQRREFRGKGGGTYHDVATGPKPFNDAIRLAQLMPQKERWLEAVGRAALRFSQALERTHEEA